MSLTHFNDCNTEEKENMWKKAIRTVYGNVKGMPILRRKKQQQNLQRERKRVEKTVQNTKKSVQFHLMRQLSMPEVIDLVQLNIEN